MTCSYVSSGMKICGGYGNMVTTDLRGCSYFAFATWSSKGCLILLYQGLFTFNLLLV